MKTALVRLLGDRALLCVLALVAVNAFALSGELRAGRFDLNDSVFHYTLVDRIVQAIERGENPLDCWVSEWTLGYPVPRTYQILGHISVALLYFALGKTVSVLTLFVWARFLLIAFLPLTVYVSARLLMLPISAAVASAALSPLIATNNLYGLEYGSYLWRGNGLFTQAVAMHFLLLTLGFGFRVMRGKSSPVLTGLLLGLTFLAHFIFGFIGALSLLVLSFLPNVLELRQRLARIAVLACIAFSVAAFQLVPMLLDGFLINHSRWEAPWKWDSFGASYVFSALLRGDLFDYGRLPALSLLVLVGAVACIGKMRKGAIRSGQSETPVETYPFLLCGAVLWLLLFCGRPAWGVLFTLLHADQLQLHRLVGGFHAFAFFLMGIGLGSLWDWLLNRKFPYRYTVAAGMTAAILFPVLEDRSFFLQQNTEWGETNLAALNVEQKEIDHTIAAVGVSSGRAFSGLGAAWGNQFKVGSVPFFALMSTHHIPALSYLYHSMALTSDLMVLFDESNPAHYRLFNVSTVIAPDTRPAMPFLKIASSFGRFRIYDAPANGYFDVVQVPYRALVYPETFYDVNDAWLKSNWVSRLHHVLLDSGTTGPGRPDLPLLGYSQPLQDVARSIPGIVVNQKRTGENYEATVQLQEPGYALFKMTYHPNWTAVVDGQPEAPVMLTPGFMGVQLNAGRHSVQFRYAPGPLKGVLIFLGIVVLVAGALAERRGALEPMDFAVERAILRVREKFSAKQVAAISTLLGLIALSLPVAVPLVTSRLLSGHDAFSYVPRLIEFHENIRHGVLLPRWAPDLDSGHGQPLFLFNPPLLYYLAEVWYVLGFQPTTAYNIVCLLVIFASAALMYLLGSFYFGRTGGWLAAAAYIYAPYFHVNLYVRQALAEFTAFPFYPLTLYAFGRFAREKDRRFLVVGAAGLAGVFLSHNAAALLFAPVAAVFMLYTAWTARSRKLLFHLAGGMVLGLALSAFVWLPVLMEMQDVHVERLLEGGLRYSNHLVEPGQFLNTSWGFGLSGPGASDEMSFSLGWSHVLLLMAAIALSWRRRHAKELLPVMFAGVVVVYCFIMTPAALWIWNNIRTLQFIEFPWRMLGPVSAGVAFVVASLPVLASKFRRGVGLAIALALLIGPNLSHIGPERYYHLSPADWNAEQIARRGVSVTTREEYEPRWVLSRPQYMAEKFRTISGDARFSTVVTNPASWSAQIKSTTDNLIQANLLYFPGWTTTIDGVKAPQEIASETGNIQVRVPAGDHRLELSLRKTPPRFYGELISLIAFLCAGLVLWTGSGLIGLV